MRDEVAKVSDAPPRRHPEAADPDAPTEPFAPVTAIARPSARVRMFGSAAYFRLWLAQVLSSLGDWVGFSATVVIAARVGGSSPEAAIGLVMSARIVPGLLFSQLAGVLVDRWDRKRVMVVCDVGRGLVLATFPLIDHVWQLLLASFVLELLTILWSPAKEASVPNLVPPGHLASVNSLSLVAAYGTLPLASITFAVLVKVAEGLDGVPALSFLSGTRSEVLAIGFDVLTFFASAAIIATLPLVHRRRTPDRRRRASGVAASVRAFGHEVREGWRFIFINHRVRGVMAAMGCGFIGGGMLVPLGPVFVRDVLDGGAASFGVMLSALGGGVAVGVVAVSAMQRTLAKPRVFAVAVMLAGAALIVAAGSSSLGPAAACIAVLGVCAGTVYVLGFTLLQQSVGDELRGRVFSSLYTLVRMCLLVAFTLGPFLAGLLDRSSRAVLGADRTLQVGLGVFLPGVRLALWAAGATMLGACGLAVMAFRAASPTGRARDLDRSPR